MSSTRGLSPCALPAQPVQPLGNAGAVFSDAEDSAHVNRVLRPTPSARQFERLVWKASAGV